MLAFLNIFTDSTFECKVKCLWHLYRLTIEGRRLRIKHQFRRFVWLEKTKINSPDSISRVTLVSLTVSVTHSVVSHTLPHSSTWLITELMHGRGVIRLVGCCSYQYCKETRSCTIWQNHENDNLYTRQTPYISHMYTV